MSTSGRQRRRAERTQAELGRGSTRASPRASLQLSRRRLQRIATIGRGGVRPWRSATGRHDRRCWVRITAADRIAVCSLEVLLPGGRKS